MKFKNYDYYLIILTTLILFAIGAVSLLGITYYNYLAVDSQWTKTTRYVEYIDDMDAYLYPFLVLLLISLGLCIPKRLFEQRFLVRFCVIILGMTVVITIFSGLEKGLGFLLAIIIIIQTIVLIMTAAKSKSTRFEKEGFMVKMGSSLLHLGFVIIIFNFISLRDSPFHLWIFWAGTILIISGNIMSFYPEKMA